MSRAVRSVARITRGDGRNIGVVLESLLQTCGNIDAPKPYFERLLVTYKVLGVMHTDKLWSFSS
ncbi:hypothetical protein HNQ08_005191 [Deinococcus humi]|uniref:Uncharacterized protein n=1 Tax=Deinococcus humi TaxID=662880 RepID=A0A7W8JZG6_9DEIO|nr:hypothetical protein [Deinococcus humi]